MEEKIIKTAIGVYSMDELGDAERQLVEAAIKATVKMLNIIENINIKN